MVSSILKLYPDYGKAPPEYIAGLIAIVASYPVDVQEAFSDIRKGIPARCKFIPTVADFVELGAEIEASKAKWAVPQKPVRQPDTSEYNPVVVPQYFDKRGNRMTEREFLEHAADLEQSAIIKKRQDRMNAYAIQLGKGDLFQGWLEIMRLGINEPPKDFEHEAAS